MTPAKQVRANLMLARDMLSRHGHRMTPLRIEAVKGDVDRALAALDRMPVSVTYRAFDPTLDAGNDRVLFGVYRVELENGFVYTCGHTGFPGTVSEQPVDLDANPEFREHLIESAGEELDMLPEGR